MQAVRWGIHGVGMGVSSMGNMDAGFKPDVAESSGTHNSR